MKLRYRGVSYEYSPPAVKVAEGEVAGKYRGASFKASVVIENPVPQVAHTLTYRGVTYTTQGQVAQEAAQPIAAAQTLFNRRRSVSDIEAAHRNTMLKNVERRLKVAQSKGDENLIHMLEDERNQLA